ncbi:MAG: TIGR00730 family Rossman fold protein [Campylobacteraceae bacterium]
MTLTVFCGSRFGDNDIYKNEAVKFGEFIAKHNHTLVYGGGSVGLMGALSSSAYKNGAEVIGIIPRALQELEKSSYEVSKLILVDSMHERKAIMSRKADIYVVLPGGIGTLEEFFEVWTWSQLTFHKKRIFVLDINGYYDKLFSFIEDMVNRGFLKKEHQDLVSIYKNSEELFLAINIYDKNLT